ncbi:MAG: rhombosortase [Desulfuromonadales bacterium]|nr:rhombosortase [Desulfuromonadales bacterium]MDW7757916.1 rhombosortase [Desulfuromonadales bacterium]
MGRSPQKELGKAPPALWLLAAGGFFSLATTLLPDLAALFIYDRQGILRGEWWRLVSGHFVHFSHEHLVANLLALGASGWVFSRFGSHCLPRLWLTSTLAISISLLIFIPRMDFYGGLSGLVTAQFAFICVMGLNDREPLKILSQLGLIALVIKLFWEVSFGGSLLHSLGTQPFEPAPLAHLAGGLAGAWLARRKIDGGKRELGLATLANKERYVLKR